MALIPAKEFLARFKKRKPEPPKENESDRYYDAMGDLIEQHPIGRPRPRGCGDPS